ncbi:MAG: ABC transporter substrate-binding protein [Bacteroidetes bacterium]|nr:ABC transporter substrate-binding protein [Bacteroidota bacterium]
MKKIIFILMMVTVLIAGLSAAGTQEQSAVENKNVSLWYLWGGTEGENVETMIQQYNTMQDNYIVEGLSVPDQQKIQVAIAAGDGPDLTDTFSSLTNAYAAKGILEPLSSYIERDNYDIDDFMPSAIASSTVDGEIYALPVSVNLMMLYYNKDLLAKAGYNRPPETDAELLEYAIATTETDVDGTINVLGFPDFPDIYFKEHMTYALGGDYVDINGKLTPDNSGIRKAMNLILAYREKFGLDNVLAINSSGGYMSAADPFISGRQALRIDGPWFGSHIKNVLKLDLNYDVAPIPYPAGQPELARGGQVQASTFYIASNAKNKDGAWDFMSWLLDTKQMATLSAQMGWTPARISALEDSALSNVTDFAAFTKQAKSPNLTIFPAFDGQQEYQKIIGDAFDKVILFTESIDDALAAAEKQTQALDY